MGTIPDEVDGSHLAHRKFFSGLSVSVENAPPMAGLCIVSAPANIISGTVSVPLEAHRGAGWQCQRVASQLVGVLLPVIT
jgi:hypothetical protein